MPSNIQAVFDAIEWPEFILGAMLVVYVLVYLYSNYQSLKSLFLSVKNFVRDYIIYGYQTARRNLYDRKLSEPDFIEWQQTIMSAIYSGLLGDYSREHGLSVDAAPHITKLTIESEQHPANTQERSYESFTWSMPPVDFPFQGICDKQTGLRCIEPREYRRWADYLDGIDLSSNELRTVRSFKRMISNSVHFPDRIGYMLDEFYCADGEIDDAEQNGDTGQWRIKATAGVYMENVLQSHVLEYELYKLYKRWPRLNIDIKTTNPGDLLELLPLRKRIHDTFNEHPSNIIAQGYGRASLIGVQAFVIVKNGADGYDCLRIRRSTDVAAKAGYLQFIPSGGLEAFNQDNSRDAQWENFSLSKALFRELAEECFGLPDDGSNDKLSPESIYVHKDIKKLLEALGEGNNASVKLQFMGVTESLVGLRPELCFIMLIENEDIVSNIIANEESAAGIHFISIKNLEDPDFWVDAHGSSFDDLAKLNCTSAGLFELARNNRIYEDCLKTARDNPAE